MKDMVEIPHDPSAADRPAASPSQAAFSKLRSEMVEKAILARGVRSELVLNAMRSVARETFLPKQLREFAYDDCPLPIEGEQTISQPYIVAFMTEALALAGGEKVLEIGTGSGYAAAVLAEIAGDVYTVERIGQLAEKAASTLADLGYDNVHVLHGDGTKGWPDHAPYDGIIVAAGGPKIPESLKEQLKIGGRLVIPVGRDPKVQELVRVTRVSESEFRREDLADVRFVPLIGHEGWGGADREPAPAQRSVPGRTLAQAVAASCEPFESIETADLDRLLARIGDAKVVLLGEATHGTSEFYRMRDRITRELITKKNFHIRRHRGRLAGCRSRGPLRAAPGICTLGVDRFCPFPGLDVAQQRGAGVRRLAPRAQRATQDRVPRRVSWARFVQPLRFDTSRAEISRSGGPGHRAGRARALRLPDTLAVRSRHLWPRRPDRSVSHLRAGCRHRADRSAAQAPRIRRTRRRALPGCGAKRPPHRQCRALLPHHVLRLARSPGICATATCSKR